MGDTRGGEASVPEIDPLAFSKTMLMFRIEKFYAVLKFALIIEKAFRIR
jgi:hypothetical protein